MPPEDQNEEPKKQPPEQVQEQPQAPERQSAEQATLQSETVRRDIDDQAMRDQALTVRSEETRRFEEANSGSDPLALVGRPRYASSRDLLQGIGDRGTREGQPLRPGEVGDRGRAAVPTSAAVRELQDLLGRHQTFLNDRRRGGAEATADAPIPGKAPEVIADKMVTDPKTGEKVRVPERQVTLGGQTISQKLYPDGRVETSVGVNEGATDNRTVSSATYQPGVGANNGTIEATGKNGKIELGADTPIARNGSEAIYADGRRVFTITDDQRRVAVTEFPPNDPQGRARTTQLRPEANGGVSSETVMRDGTVMRQGRDERGEYTSRTRNDAQRGQLTETTYKEGGSKTEANGKVVEQRFPDGRYVFTPEKGEPSSGRSQEFTTKTGEKGLIDVDDRTGRVAGMRFTEGARAGQELRFQHDAQGRLNNITLADGRTVQAGPDGKFDGEAAKALGFSLDAKNAKDGKFELRVNGKGDLVADNGKGVRQYVRTDGTRDTYDNNAYSRTRETPDGKQTVDHWDGYSWRQAKNVRTEGTKTTVEFDDAPGRPRFIERDSKNDGEPKTDSLKVKFADNSTYEADWRNQSQVFTDGPSGKKTEFFNSGQTDQRGRAVWRQGQRTESGDITLNTQNTTPAELEKMRRGETPHRIQINKDTQEITSHYANGAKVVSDARGNAKSVTYRNGDTFKFDRDADGRINSVLAPDGTTYQRRGDQAVGADGSKSDKWTMFGGQPPREIGTFSGSFNARADGTVERRQLDGNLTTHENNGRTVVTNRYGGVSQITEANGQKWLSERIPGTGNQPENANKRVWRLAGDDKVTFIGEHKLQPDGTVSFATKDGAFRRNTDASTSRMGDKGNELERNWDNGAFLKRNADGLPSQTRDAAGVTRDLSWTKDKDGKPTLSEVKVTDAKGQSTVEKPDPDVDYALDGTRSKIKKDAEGKVIGMERTFLNGLSVDVNNQRQITEVRNHVPGRVPPDQVLARLGADQQLRAVNADGKPNGPRAIVTADGIATQKPDGDFVSQKTNGTFEHIDRTGRFQYSTDKDGRRLRVADSRGGEANFIYENGKLARIESRHPDRPGTTISKPGEKGSASVELSDGRTETYDADGKLTKRAFNDGSSIDLDAKTGLPTKARDVYGTERTFRPAGQWPPSEVETKREGQTGTTIEKRDSSGRLREFNASTKMFGDVVEYDQQGSRYQFKSDDKGTIIKSVQDSLNGQHVERSGREAVATNRYAEERARREASRPASVWEPPPLPADEALAISQSQERMLNRAELPAEIRGTKEATADPRTGDGATLQHQRRALQAHAESLGDPQRRDIIGNMRRFEERAKREGISEAEIAKTYFQANRLLEANPAELNNGLDKGDFARTAQSLIHGAARPGDTNQGNHLTCNVTVLREAMLTKTPSKAGAIAADAMTSKAGIYTAPDGQKIRLDFASMKADRESLTSSQDSSKSDAVGRRTQLGQVLDHVLVNHAQQKEYKGQNSMAADSVMARAVYTQVRPQTGPEDTGERLQVPGKVLKTNPDVDTNMMADLSTTYTGRNNVLVNFDLDPKSKLPIKIRSQEAMDHTLQEKLKEGPMSVLVHDGHPAINADGRRVGTLHVFSVTDSKKINDKTYYRVSDTAGSSTDKWISSADLYNATLSPPKHNRTAGPTYADKLDGSGRVVQDADGKPAVIELKPAVVPIDGTTMRGPTWHQRADRAVVPFEGAAVPAGNAVVLDAAKPQSAVLDRQTSPEARREAIASLRNLEAEANPEETVDQRLDRLAKSMQTSTSPADLQKAETALANEVDALTKDKEAGRPGSQQALERARDLLEQSKASTAIAEINAATSTDSESMRNARAAIDRLAQDSEKGNKYAHKALVEMASSGGNVELAAFRFRAAQHLDREVRAAGGNISTADADALTAGLARARAEGQTAMAQLLQRPLDAALAGQGKQAVTDAMGKAIADGVPGATTLTEQFLANADAQQVEKQFAKIQKNALGGDEASIKVVAGIASGAAANSGLSAKDQREALATLEQLGKQHPEHAALARTAVLAAVSSSKETVREAAVDALMRSADTWGAKELAAVKANMTPDMVRALQSLPKETLSKHQEQLLSGVTDVQTIGMIGGRQALEKAGLKVEADPKDQTRFTATDKDGTTYQFRAADPNRTNLESITRKDGTSVANSYDASGKYLGRVENDGKGTSTTYDREGNISRVALPNGEVRNFERTKRPDGTSYISRVTESNGAEWKADATGTVYSRTGSSDRVRGTLTAKANGDYSFEAVNNTRIDRLASNNAILLSDTSRSNPAEQLKLRVNDDGSAVVYDAGKVTSTTDARRQQTQYGDHGPDGQPRSIREGDTTWRTQDGTTWTNNKGEIRRQKEHVNPTDGTRTSTILDQAGNPNGEVVRKLDGSQVQKDTQGRVSSVTDKNGNVTRFGYKDQNERQPSSMEKQLSGRPAEKWSTPDGKNWRREGSNQTVAMDVIVDGAGNYTEKRGNLTETKQTDGWTKVVQDGKTHFENRNADGSFTVKNEQGQITAIHDRNGGVRRFERDGNGQIVGITEPNGEKWTRKANTDEWTSSDAQKPVRKFEPQISERGLYREVSADSVRTVKTDGSEITQNKEGKVTEVIEAERVNIQSAERNSKALQDTLKQQRPDLPTVLQALQGKTDAERRAIAADYQAKTGTKLEDALRGKLYGQDLDRALGELNKQGVVGERRRAYELDAQGVSKIMEGPKGQERTLTRTKAAADGQPAEWTGPDGKIIKANVTIYGDGTSELNDAETGLRTTRTTDGKTTVHKGEELVSVETPDGVKRQRREGADPSDPAKKAMFTDVTQPDGSAKTYQDDKGLVSIRNRDGSSVDLQNGFITAVRGPDGKPVSQVKYDSAQPGKVTEYMDPQGRWHKLAPNEKAAVQARTAPDGTVTADVTVQNEASKRETKILSDGTTQVKDRAGILTYNQTGELVGSHNTATGVGYKFTWKNGQVNSTERFEQGQSKGVWTRTHGNHFTGPGGAGWTGTVSLDTTTGAMHSREFGHLGHERYFHPSKQEVVVDGNVILKAVEDIEDACNRGINRFGTDEDKIKDVLRSLPHIEQRQRLESLYQARYKHSLQSEFADEMGSGHHYVESMNLLRARNHKEDYEGAILTALQEHRQTFEGRSEADSETAIRRTLAPRTAAELKELDTAFQRRQRDIGTDGRPVQTLRQATVENTDLSEGTRQANDIYLKGADQRKTQDFLDLAQIGIQHRNLEIFQEAWMGATEAARETFLKEVRDGKTGEQRMNDAFGSSWRNFWSDTNLNRARDYQQLGGELGLGTQITDNTSVLGDNETAIENALRTMSDEQRSMYIRGREVVRAGGDLPAMNTAQQAQFDRGRELVIADKKATDPTLSADDKAAIQAFQKRRFDERSLDYYRKADAAMHTAAGHFFSENSTINEQAKWHDMAMRKGGSLVSQLAAHRGDIYDSGTHDVMSTIEKMNATDLERLKRDPEYRDEVRKVIKTFADGSESDPTSEVSRALALVDKKIATEANTSRGKALAEQGFDPAKLTAEQRKDLELYRGYGPNADTNRMTPEQKKAYDAGRKTADDVAALEFHQKYERGKVAFAAGLDPSKVTEEQIRALQAFRHYGSEFDASKVPEAARQNIPEQQKLYEAGKKLSEDLAALEFYKKESFKAAQVEGRRDVLSAIDDNTRWYNNNEDNIYEALTHLTPTEIHNYQHNVKAPGETQGFRDKLDAKVNAVLDSSRFSDSERTVARGLLAQAAEGKQPKFDIVDKLNRHASDNDPDEAKVARDIEQAFRDDPSLQQRVANPRSAAQLKDAYDKAMQLPEGVQSQLAQAQRDGNLDQRVNELASRWNMQPDQLKQAFGAAQSLPPQYVTQITEAQRKGTMQQTLDSLAKAETDYSRQFKAAAERAFGDQSDYKRYGEPLINQGQLSLETKMELNEGVFNDDEQGFYLDAANASPETRQRLLADPALRDKAFRNLSSDERQIAENSLQQGAMRPEDKLRSYVVGAGTSEDEIKAVFAELKDREKAKTEIMKRENLSASQVTDEMVSDAINTRLAQTRNEYTRKYGELLDVRLSAELSGQDGRDIRRGANWEGRNATEVLNDATREYWESQGWGAELTDSLGWDGTTAQTGSMYGRAIGRQVEGARDPERAPTMAEAMEIKQHMEGAVDASIESQNAMVDAVVDATITLAAVAAAIPTGGGSMAAYAGMLLSKVPTAARLATATVHATQALSKVPGAVHAIKLSQAATSWAARHPHMAWAAAGGTFKFTAKQTLVADQDLMADGLRNFADGALNAAFNADIALGPFAGRAADRAAGRISGEIIERGGKELVEGTGREVVDAALRETGGEVFEAGAKQTIGPKLTALVDDAIKHESPEMAQAAMRELAESMIRQDIKGEARTLLVGAMEKRIGDAFETAVRDELEHGVRQFFNQVAWNTKQGMLGGSAGSLARLDPDASVEQNLSTLAMGGVFGGTAGAGFTTALVGSKTLFGKLFRGAPTDGSPTAVGDDAARAATPHQRPDGAVARADDSVPAGRRDAGSPTDRVQEPKPAGLTDEMHARLQTLHPELTNPAALTDLDKRVSDAMHGAEWKEDLGPQIKRVGEIDKEIATTQAALSDQHGRDLRGRDPQVQAKIEELRQQLDGLKAQQKAVQDHVDQVARQRAQQLNEVFNGWLKDRGLSPTSIKSIDGRFGDADAAAMYLSGKGEIHISQAALLNPSMARERAKLMLHEYVHQQQDITLARKVMHDLGPGASPDAVRAGYKERTGRELQDGLYRQADEVHKSKPWTAEDDANAVRLQQAVKSYDADFARINQLVQAGKKLEPHIDALTQRPEAALQDMFKRLRDAETNALRSPHRNLRNELFENGIMPPSVKEKYNAWKAAAKDTDGNTLPGAFDSKAAADDLSAHLQLKMLRNNMEIEQVAGRYYKNEMELQSYGSEHIYDRHMLRSDADVPELSGPQTRARVGDGAMHTSADSDLANPSQMTTGPGSSTVPRATVGGTEIPLGEPMTIGRTSPDSSAKVQLDTAPLVVSRNHAEVIADGNGNRFVRDNGSRYGTTIVDDAGKSRAVGNDWVQIKPGERLLLAGHEVPFNVNPTHGVDLGGGKPVKIALGEERVFGRTDFRGEPQHVSSQHGRIGMDEKGLYVIDGVVQPDGSLRPSTNHTYVNGQKIEPGQKVYLKESDKISVGSDPSSPHARVAEVKPLDPPRERPEVSRVSDDPPSINPARKSPVMVGNWEVDLPRGSELEFGREDFATQNERISGRHGRLGRDADGRVYIVDGALQPDGSLRPSTNGTYVNGQKLTPGEKHYIVRGDDIRVGGEKYEPLVFEAYNPKPGDPKVFAEAMDQANHFGQHQEVRGRLRDGFEDGGKFSRYDKDGNLVDEMGNRVEGRRQITVVDRANDPVLRATIDDAKRQFGHLPPKQRAEALNKYVNDLLKPRNMSEDALDDWHHAFSDANRGQRVPLGRFIEEGKGVCIEQATLMKVLGDELGLDVTLVRGGVDGAASQSMNHAWTHVHLPGQKEPLVFDPRWGIHGEPYSRVPTHRQGADMLRDAGQPSPAEPHLGAGQPRGSAPRLDTDGPKVRPDRDGIYRPADPTPQQVADFAAAHPSMVSAGAPSVGTRLDDLHRRWQGDPDLAAARRQLAEATDATRPAAQKALDDIAAKRASELQTELDAVAAQGAPRLQVEVSDTMPGKQAEYDFGTGKVRVSRDVLLNNRPDELRRAIQHESVHARQDQHMMDYSLHRSGGDTTKAAAEYKRLSGRDADPALLKAAADAQSWKRNWSPADLARAESYGTAVRTDVGVNAAEIKETMDRARITEDLLHRLKTDTDGTSLDYLMGRMDTPAGQRQLQRVFPEGIPKEITDLHADWKQAQQEGNPFDAPAAKERLSTVLNKHLDELRTKSEGLYKQYADSPIEIEARAGESYMSIRDGGNKRLADSYVQLAAQAQALEKTSIPGTDLGDMRKFVRERLRETEELAKTNAPGKAQQLVALQRQMDELNGVLARVNDPAIGPNLKPEHIDAAIGLLNASRRNPDLAVPFKRILDPSTSPSAAQRYKELALDYSEVRRPGSSAGGHVHEHDLSRRMMASLTDHKLPTGKPPNEMEDWMFVPSEHNSAADAASIDGAFINAKTGRVVLADLASDPDVLSRKINSEGKLWPVMLEDRTARITITETELRKRMADFIKRQESVQVVHPGGRPWTTDDFAPRTGLADGTKPPFPSFRSFKSDPELFASGRLDTANELQKVIDNAPTTSDAWQHLANLAEGARLHRLSEVEFARKVQPAIRDAVELRAVGTDSAAGTPPPFRSGVEVITNHNNVETARTSYIEFSLQTPLTVGKRSNPVSKVRVYEDGRVVGLENRGTGDPTKLDLGNVYDMGKKFAGRERGADPHVEARARAVEEVFGQFRTWDRTNATALANDMAAVRAGDRASMDRFYEQYPGLRVLGEAFTDSRRVLNDAINSRAATSLHDLGVSPAELSDPKFMGNLNSHLLSVGNDAQRALAVSRMEDANPGWTTGKNVNVEIKAVMKEAKDLMASEKLSLPDALDKVALQRAGFKGDKLNEMSAAMSQLRSVNGSATNAEAERIVNLMSEIKTAIKADLPANAMRDFIDSMKGIPVGNREELAAQFAKLAETKGFAAMERDYPVYERWSVIEDQAKRVK